MCLTLPFATKRAKMRHHPYHFPRSVTRTRERHRNELYTNKRPAIESRHSTSAVLSSDHRKKIQIAQGRFRAAVGSTLRP